MPSLLQFRWFLINADIVIIYIRKFKNSSACLNTIKKIKKGYTKSLWKISKPLRRRKEKNQHCVIVTKISQKNKIISWLIIEKTTMKWEKCLIIIITKSFHLEKFWFRIRFFFFHAYFWNVLPTEKLAVFPRYGNFFIVCLISSHTRESDSFFILQFYQQPSLNEIFFKVVFLRVKV